jgi:hypothetical protein
MFCVCQRPSPEPMEIDERLPPSRLGERRNTRWERPDSTRSDTSAPVSVAGSINSDFDINTDPRQKLNPETQSVIDSINRNASKHQAAHAVALAKSMTVITYPSNSPKPALLPTPPLSLPASIYSIGAGKIPTAPYKSPPARYYTKPPPSACQSVPPQQATPIAKVNSATSPIQPNFIPLTRQPTISATVVPSDVISDTALGFYFDSDEFLAPDGNMYCDKGFYVQSVKTVLFNCTNVILL